MSETTICIHSVPTDLFHSSQPPWSGYYIVMLWGQFLAKCEAIKEKRFKVMALLSLKPGLSWLSNIIQSSCVTNKIKLAVKPLSIQLCNKPKVAERKTGSWCTGIVFAKHYNRKLQKRNFWGQRNRNRFIMTSRQGHALHITAFHSQWSRYIFILNKLFNSHFTDRLLWYHLLICLYMGVSIYVGVCAFAINWWSIINQIQLLRHYFLMKDAVTEICF